MNKLRFWNRYGRAYLMLAPFFLLFFTFTVLPVIIAIFVSFTNYNMFQRIEWVGLENYRMLFLDDRIFGTAMGNTLVFAFIVGPASLLLSFLAAWTIDSLKFKQAFALAFYAPSITSGIAMGVVWGYIFSNDQYGLLNNALIQIGIIDDPILWTADTRYILPVVIFVSLWMSMGTGFLVFLAGLQNVDPTYYEAARIDGIHTRYQELKFITLPLMKPQLLFNVITSVTSAFSVFDVAVSLAGFPSPNYAAHTIVAHLYDYAFTRFQMGYASAISVVLFIMTFALGRLFMRLLSDKNN